MRRRLLHCALVIAWTLGGVGCDESLSDLTGPTPNLEPTFSSIQQNIFSSGDSAGRPACTNCHNPALNRGGLELSQQVSQHKPPQRGVDAGGSRPESDGLLQQPGQPGKRAQARGDPGDPEQPRQQLSDQ